MTAQPLLCSRAGGGCRGERVVAKPCFSGVGLHSSCVERWCKPLLVRAEGSPDSPGARPTNTLEVIISRKQQQMKRYIEELGMEGLDDRLSAATQVPSSRPHRLATLVSEVMPMGTPAIMVEVSRRSPAESCNDVVRRAKTACQHGANCIAVNTDALYTPEGLKDLFAVCQAVSVPVVARDWYIHPLQLIEAKEAGAAGLLGVVAAVSGRGTPVMSSFAAALGVDAPVEVLNMQELDTMSALGVPFFAINVSVGLSLALPELRQNIMASLLSKLPPGAAAVVGVKSVEDARRAYLSGANIVLLMWDWLRDADDAALPQILDQVSYAVSGDD